MSGGVIVSIIGGVAVVAFLAYIFVAKQRPKK
jgi:hypothetical protein